MTATVPTMGSSVTTPAGEAGTVTKQVEGASGTVWIRVLLDSGDDAWFAAEDLRGPR